MAPRVDAGRGQGGVRNDHGERGGRHVPLDGNGNGRGEGAERGDKGCRAPRGVQRGDAKRVVQVRTYGYLDIVDEVRIGFRGN